MGILDIVIIAVALLFGIIGLFKGFVKGFLGALGGIISLVVAYFLCDKVAGWIGGSGFGTNLVSQIETWFTNKNPEVFGTIYPSFTNEVLTNALTTLGVPGFLHGIILGTVDLSTVHDVSIAGFLSPQIGSLAFTGIAYISIFAVVRIVVLILQIIFKKLLQFAALGLFDRIFGLVWGIVKAGIIISIIFLAVSFIITLPFGESIANWINTDINKGFGLAKFLYENNPLIWLYEKLIAKI